jgi:hypothetical protein
MCSAIRNHKLNKLSDEIDNQPVVDINELIKNSKSKDKAGKLPRKLRNGW